MVKQGSLFLISAPSGAGKTTLVHELLARFNGEYGIKRVVTYTTKKPRAGETHGTDYHFLSEEEFIQKIGENFFAEHSTACGAYVRY